MAVPFFLQLCFLNCLRFDTHTRIWKYKRLQQLFDNPFQLKHPMDFESAYDVFSAYNEKDPIAISVLHKAVEMWGMASANLVSLLNPQKIIWGGGVFGPAGIFIDDIYKEACKWAQPLSIKQVEFVPSQLSGNAGLIGAAFLAIKNHLYE